MSVVLDASVLACLVMEEPEATVVEEWLSEALLRNEDYHAPALARFEVASALTRAAADDRVEISRLACLWEQLQRVVITYHEMWSDGPEIVEIALRLKRRSAYDAAYVALARQLDANVWTLDRALARNSGENGLPVILVEATPH